ncbi:MAG: FMN-binding negative transcriptional regulator [Bryobacterales bacterium]|nr:FMN-binding negative transcriptional regulator [Bryobacterales bacterium]
MYNPVHFREERIEVLHQLIREQSLAALVTLGKDGLIANHIPLILDREPAPLGTLRGHVSRTNSQSSDLLPGVQALAIFQGPSTYITPSWYATKSATGKVVPTFNYIAVHAYGPLTTFADPARLEANVRALTQQHESVFAEPWSVDQAPADFIQSQLKGIVGVEIPIARIEGKWKASQNRVPADRQGVIDGLRDKGDAVSLAMAEWIARKNS